MTRSDARVLIVGASLAGLTTAESLRAEGHTGDILLVGSEPDLPYSRPPLSKQVLSGTWAVEQAVLRPAEELAAAGIRIRLGEPAVTLDRAAREVTLAAGDRLPYDELVIATGVAARDAAVVVGHRVAALRTLDDARRLRAAFRSGARLVVLGAGVLGSEIASAGRSAGLETALVGRSHELRLGAVGRHLSSRLIALHRDAGVRLELGRAVVGIEKGRVALDTGTVVHGDLVVAAIGGEPQTAWLQGSGLELSDGVLCDAAGRAAPHVWAVGDVARWTDRFGGRARRIEHQAVAIEHGLAVGRAIATGELSALSPPFFWSELHGVRIQAYGSFERRIPLTSFGDPLEPGRELLSAVGRDGAVRGIVGWNAPRPFRIARAEVDRHVALAALSREVVA